MSRFRLHRASQAPQLTQAAFETLIFLLADAELLGGFAVGIGDDDAVDGHDGRLTGSAARGSPGPGAPAAGA